MAKYLVTGGAGFIGSNLVEELVKSKENSVVVIDDLSMGLKSNLPDSKQVTFFQHTITDFKFMKTLLLKEKFDYIVLLAAIASVADSVERPFETHLVNQEANINILETIRKNNLPIKKLYFASSAAVYGDGLELPKRESGAVAPLTQYAVDKFATEREVINFGRLYGIPTVCGRFFNVFGPKQNPASPYSGVLSIIMDKLNSGDQFTLFGDGSQTRDFIYVKDVVNAISGLLHTPEALHDVYNIANGKQTSLMQVISMLEDATGKKLNYELGEPRQGDIKDSVADVSKIEALGFMTHTPLDEGLASYVASVQ
ncbi:NAD-dependent epimerase/dehydratase family protein [Lacticaseibacillus zhaodongensis]|uniref:NAD-dependent epimerase/dehydratase family protein n=1 Tax=Lacticaseibacillus zhaodongensis TaxID=2668065 RepID=UPI0012D30ED2|nr:NAD-dependent epimerase/dehydratase family protein [Lacticaseibacillus zhaodongensis]